MRRGPSDLHKTSLTRAAFVCAALVFVLAVAWAVGAALSRKPVPPAEAPSPMATEKVVAWFGSSSDPFCAPLYDAIEETCRANGWRLLSYDCKGRAAGQKGQIEDFLRTEQADAAVLYSVMEESELNGQVKALAAACPVVTVGQRAGTTAGRYVAAHIGGEERQRTQTLAEYLAENGRGKTALLMTEVPDEKMEREMIDGLSAGNVSVLDHNYTWGGQVYAERYMNTALDTFSEVDAVVCISRHGAAGAQAVLTERGLRDRAKIVSLCYDPAMADDLALGLLDAAVAFAPQEAGEKLSEVLPAVLAGKETEDQTLTPVLLTPENVDETELGYE